MAKNKKILLISGAVICAIAIVFVCFLALGNKEKTMYTVSFNSNGGTIISNQVLESGKTAKIPDDPTKDGYMFVEWLLNGKLFDFNTPIESNITLVAKWQEVTPEKELVTIKFNSDGGTTIANIIVEKGNKIEKPEEPKKDGYTFVEWQLANVKYNFDEEVTENIELIAIWQKNSTNKPNTSTSGANNSGNNNPGTTQTIPTETKYTVTFNSNGGSNVSNQQVKEGSKASRPSNPTRNGYTFAGWTLNGNTYDFNSAVRGNITLVAQWTENVKTKYTVTFNSNGGSNVSNQQIEEGSKASRPSNPTRNGYTFAGWTLNGSTYDFNSAVRGNITLVAQWNEKVYTVTVSNVDQYSPDRILAVYEDGTKINVSSIQYNGVTLCSGSNMVVNMYEIQGISSVTVLLTNGTSVTARIV